MSALVIYQIYYREEQKKDLEFIPYYNYPTTVFFESMVMCKLIEEKKHTGEYFGVLGPNFRKKIRQSKSWGPTIANKSSVEFSPVQFEKFVKAYKPDVAGMCNHMSHAVYPIAERFHHGISRATIKILEKLKYRTYWDTKSLKPIYFNYFVARSRVYEKYVTEMLRPAIELMSNDKEIIKLVNIDSGYKKKVTPELREQIGYEYYPLQPFITERLINLFIARENLKIITW